MLLEVLMALFLPCVGMGVVFGIYFCLLWCSGSLRSAPSSSSVNGPDHEFSHLGVELEKLPRASGKELVSGTECAVCLDEIGTEQPVRLVPGCNHGFHLHCADTWLSKNPVCPLCRAQLGPDFFNPSLHRSPC